jgi:hypothetical protein
MRGKMMDTQSESEMETMARALVVVAAVRYERRQFDPFGLYMRNDGSLGSVAAEEGGHSVDSLMDLFKSMARDALAFAIVVFMPRKDGACLFSSMLEHRAGHCVFGMANLHEDENGDTDLSDETFARGLPELFVVHH